jgi:hypothetical protein
VKNSDSRSRFASSFRVTYTWFLPLIIAIALLIISSRGERSPFLGSWTLDLFARIYIILILSAGLVFLPRPEKLRHWFYGKELSSSAPANDIAVRLFIFGCALMYGVFAALIVRWAIQLFLPSLASVSTIMAILSGLIYAIPFLVRGRDFVL